jgi:hypothetical protein
MNAVVGGSLPQTHLRPSSEGVENAVVVVVLLLMFEHSLILSMGYFREQSPAPILNHSPCNRHVGCPGTFEMWLCFDRLDLERYYVQDLSMRFDPLLREIPLPLSQ